MAVLKRYTTRGLSQTQKYIYLCEEQFDILINKKGLQSSFHNMM